MTGGPNMKTVGTRFFAILLLTMFIFSPTITAGYFEDTLTTELRDPVETVSLSPLKSSIMQEKQGDQIPEIYSTTDPGVDDKWIPEEYDITKHLSNNELQYQNVWEPWLTKAAVRCIATDQNQEWIAVGGGYLYDNEIHLYRWNEFTREYDKVWDSGDQIIQGDVLSIDFGDTDNNDFIEIVAGSADGHVYVFEQEHIFDPVHSTENQFVHVWTSPKIQQVWGVKVADTDMDNDPDIIAGAWDGKIHFYEYINHSGYPFSKEHWIEYAEKVTIDVGEKIFSLAVGDTNPTPGIRPELGDLPDIVVGTEFGRVYIFENNGTRLYMNGKPFALRQDNSYRYHWDSGNTSWKPVHRVIVDNLDDDEPDEVVYISNGQGVYVINFDRNVGPESGTYLTHQLWEPFESWELGGFEGLGHYLNHYIDFMPWSNNNMTSDAYKPIPANNTHYQRFHVYPNGSMVATTDYILIENLHVYYYSPTGIRIAEPFAYMWEPQWPKNTSMAIHRKLDPWGEDGVNIVNPPISHPPAENYTVFAARNTYASAIVDWGKDQEVMGDGLWAIPEESLGYDVDIRFHQSTLPNLEQISFEISPTGEEWALIPNEDISFAEVSAAAGDDDLWMDIDPILSKKRWAYFRYMRINVTNGGYFWIKGGYAPVVYRPVDTAISLTIGSLDLSYYKAYTSGESEGKKIVIGTSDGKLIMFQYNATTKAYDLLWNSYKDDSYTQGTNIWDIVEVKSAGKIPNWLYNESDSRIFDDEYGDPIEFNALDWKISQLESLELSQGKFLGPYGEFASLTHVSLSSLFFDAIFNSVPEYSPLKDIIELKIPDNDIVIGTTNGKLMVIPELTHNISTLAYYFFFAVNSDPFYVGTSVSPTFLDFNQDPDHFPEIMLLSWARNGQLYDPTVGMPADAGIDFYTFDPIAYPLGVYTGKFEMANIEITGLLERALAKSQRMPETAIGDVDNDGDLDIVLTNGRIYYLENIENAMFNFKPEFFEDLNIHATDKLFDSPQLYDFDQDGDLDLTVGWSNRKRTINSTTYYQNVGTKGAPQWEENKWLYTNSWGGLRFNNLVSASIATDEETGLIDHLTTYSRESHQIVQLKAEYDNHNAYVIGTNPIIARLELNLKSGTDSHGNQLANYGYHVFETWNTEPELARWTLTLETGDVDQDGRGEVIIGDYDNNLYVFEHLTNNTYKRAFRSQDITHSELSTTSPYAWDLLEGVSGTFYRTIWDHIEELVVGLDMDNDGFKEMVATAGLSIFVWEQRNNGFVSVDDEYDLIWHADLRHSAWAELFADLEITEFTAAAYGGDLDYNGYGEFVLAAGSFLFVFESNGADQFYENFLVDPFPVRGRYFIPGNPLSSPAVRRLSIESIVVDDTDHDGLNEIIIGGLNKTWWGQYNGFVAILENQIGTYAYTWWAPMRLMEDNPVFDITIDNQDYDRYKEIIIGTFKGIVIYENADLSTRDNTYVERSILTSYVNFPTIKLKQMFDIEAKIPLTLRNTDFIELQNDYPATNGLKKGDWIQIFKAGTYLFWANSSDYGDTWTQRGRVTTNNLVTIYGGFDGSTYELHPSIYQTRDGNIWLTLSARLAFGAATQTIREGIWLLRLEEDVGDYWWEIGVTPSADVAIEGSSHLLYNPSVWEHQDNWRQGVAISYLNFTDGGIYWQGDFTNPTADPAGQIPNIGRDAASNKYLAVSHDTIRSESGNVIIVFSGSKYTEAKVDLDLWIAKANSTPIWSNKSSYSRATIDAIDELHPSITQTVTSDHALMIIYEAEGDHPSGALHITYSKDDGETWRDPEPVTTTPPFAEWIIYPVFGFSLLVLKDNPFIIVKSLISVGPAITAHWEGGFAYSYMAQYAFFSVGSITISQNVASAQTLNRGYSGSKTTTETTLVSTGDISAHSGLVSDVGGGMTTGGGMLSYQGAPIGSFINLTYGGGGSAVTYSSYTSSTPVVNYQSSIVQGGSTYTAYGGSVIAYGDDAAGTDDPGEDQNTGSGYSGGGMALTHAVNFGGQDFHSDRKYSDRGYYNNIFFGMNPSSNFTLFDFKEAKAISTGDSDNDYRREIAVASGNQAFLVEVARTGGKDRKDQENHVLQYYQPWHSDGFPSTTTDIELYDANGNGIDEIIVSCEGGDVFSFEGAVTNAPPTNYLHLDWDPLWVNTNYSGYINNIDPLSDVLIDTTDIGLDGVDDLIAAAMNPLQMKGNANYPIIRAINGSSGINIWVFNTSEYLPLNSTVLTLKTVDLTLDGVKDVVFICYNFDSNETNLFGLDATTGTELWNNIPLIGINISRFNEIAFEDLNQDNTSDILVLFGNAVYTVDGAIGSSPTILHAFSNQSWIAEHVSFGNNSLLISGRMINSENGSVILMIYNETHWNVNHEFVQNNSRLGLTATLLDVTDDGQEEVLILESGTLYAYDLDNVTHSIWNRTFEGAVGNYKDTLQYDFNGDAYQDVMFQVQTTKLIETVDFEGLQEYMKIGEYYPGLKFSNTGPAYVGYTVRNYSYSSTYVPNSGDMALTTVEPENFIVIKGQAYEVSAYFSTGARNYNWSAFDKDGNLLDYADILPSTPLQLIKLEDPQGRIYRVKVGGLSGGSSFFVLDDFSYHRRTLPSSKFVAMSGRNPDDILWEYNLWNTHANEISQGDIDRDGEADDLLFLTEYNPGYPHTGAMTAIDGTYGTPFVHLAVLDRIMSVAAGNFGEYGEIAFLFYRSEVYDFTFVRHEPTYYREMAVQMNGTASFEARGMVTQISTGDFNRDGIDDVVFGDRARYVIALDGKTGDMIWKYRTKQPIVKLVVSDFYLQDGYSDVVVALRGGLLIGMSGFGGIKLWEDYLGPVIVNEMKFVDVNNDGITDELAISMGFRFTSHKGWFILYDTWDSSLDKGSRIWQAYNPYGPFTHFEVANFDNDANGILDFAVAIFDEAIWFYSGEESGGLIHIPFNKEFWIPVHDFRVGNFSDSILPELAVIIRNGTVLTYSTSDWSQEVNSSHISGKINLDIPFRLTHMDIGDFYSNDGFDDIVVRSFGDATYCLQGGKLSLGPLWIFEDRSIFYLPQYRIVDMNNDSVLDIISLNHDNIFALDCETGEVVWASFVPSYLIRSTTIGDFNADSIMDVAIGTADRWVYFLYGEEESIIIRSKLNTERLDSNQFTPIETGQIMVLETYTDIFQIVAIILAQVLILFGVLIFRRKR